MHAHWVESATRAEHYAVEAHYAAEEHRQYQAAPRVRRCPRYARTVTVQSQLDYLREDDRRRRQAADELSALTQEIGLV